MRRCLIALAGMLALGCRSKNVIAQEAEIPTVTAEPTGNQDTSDRAATALARTRPELEQALAAKGLRFGDPVFLRAFKEERLLELWLLQRETQRYVLFRSWPIAAASGELGPKLAEGDNQVPEGCYFVTPDRLNPRSQFHLAFNIGYPNAYDQAHQRTGSSIMIHGAACSIGCLAMTNAKIEDIYTLCAAALRNGQPFFRVHIFPFRLTPERLAAAAGQPSVNFWKNLQQGYELFERDRLPPAVTVENLRYVFKTGFVIP
jgi:murein L,D-transpeptidase YafK